ncbi:GntR family transcriptional regulator [Roseibium sp. Sym1]|uniref:GntR family transcriptional regulator n=1 Tax=Roseibium sp. Sym1 TaxID=3016006 RepID=UPI0022B3E8A1|nr:GntR family transcriptional regulator [Roseibium sp. Sym1]
MKKPPRVEIVYRALRQAIIEQDLAPGTKLPEDEIGVPFNISRTLVRQALARLQSDGLVDTGGKKTATVARPSLAESKDVFRVRRALEREVIRIVAETWSPAHGAALEGHVRKEDAARAAGNERISVRLAAEFHILLAELTENPVLIGYITQLVSRCSLILALYGRPHATDCAVNEHRDVVTALREGNVDEAVRLMDHHVSLVESRALNDEDRSGPALSEILSRHAGEIEADQVTDAITFPGGNRKQGT